MLSTGLISIRVKEQDASGSRCPNSHTSSKAPDRVTTCQAQEEGHGQGQD